MRKTTLPLVRCPETGQPLRLETPTPEAEDILAGQLISPSGRVFPIVDGVPNLVYPEELLPSDEEFLQQYEGEAQRYDVMVDFLFKTFFEDEHTCRAQIAQELGVGLGDRVLEVSTGTGANLSHILEQVGPQGDVFALDLSQGMMGVARQKMAAAGAPVEFFLGNAAYLPFEDDIFDGLLHIGGLNTFGEIEKALAEMARVVKVGGKVVVSDEGMAPWLLETEYGLTQIMTNKLFAAKPPLHAIPTHARNVKVEWVVGSAFYMIVFTVGEDVPHHNLDLEIPGQGITLGDYIQGLQKKE